MFDFLGLGFSSKDLISFWSFTVEYYLEEDCPPPDATFIIVIFKWYSLSSLNNNSSYVGLNRVKPQATTSYPKKSLGV